MRILSIDHSFKRTGVAVMDNYKLIYTGVLSFGKMNYENIYNFYCNIVELIKYFEPDVVVTEKPAHLRNGEISRMLTGLHTVAVLASVRASKEYGIVNPKVAKKVITGNGSATKEDVMECLIETYGYPEEMLCKKNYYKKDKTKVKDIDYDESDAVSNAVTYLIERGIKYET